MFLAQALTLRKKMEHDIESAIRLISNTSYVAVGEPKPKRNPNEVLGSLNGMMDDLSALVCRIDEANSKTVLSNGMTIRQAMAKRKVVTYMNAKIAERLGTFSRKDEHIRILDADMVSQFNNNNARMWRELDDLIQEANWKTEV